MRYVSSCSCVISADHCHHHLPHSLIGVAFYKCYNHWPDAVANNAKRTDTFSTTLQSVDDLDRKSPIVKVTGFRLFCTVLPLGLTLAKYALSAGDNSVSSNELDLVGYVVGSIVCVLLKIPKAEIQKFLMLIPPSRLVWMGYYSESHETFAPWFFHDDYSQIVFRGLGVLVIFCVAGIVASLLIPLYAIDRIPPVIILPGFVNMINVPLNEQRLYVCIAWAFGLHVAFIVLEGGLFLSIRSAERPMGGQILKWTCRFNSINAILCICLRFWRESDIQSFLHFLTLYERWWTMF